MKSGTLTTTMEDYRANKNENSSRFTESVSNNIIHTSEGQAAFVKTDTILDREEKAQLSNLDYFTLLKENGIWKLLSAAYTVRPIIIK